MSVRQNNRVSSQNRVDLDQLVEEIWNQFDKRPSRERVQQVAAEVVAAFQDATITSFVPIFVRRLTEEKLAREVRKLRSG